MNSVPKANYCDVPLGFDPSCQMKYPSTFCISRGSPYGSARYAGASTSPGAVAGLHRVSVAGAGHCDCRGGLFAFRVSCLLMLAQNFCGVECGVGTSDDDKIYINISALWPFHWRRGRDSNPRYGYPYSAFRVRRDRPLCHLSGAASLRLDEAPVRTARGPYLASPRSASRPVRRKDASLELERGLGLASWRNQGDADGLALEVGDFSPLRQIDDEARAIAFGRTIAHGHGYP